MANMILKFFIRSVIRKAVYSKSRGKVNPTFVGVGLIVFFFMIGLYGR